MSQKIRSHRELPVDGRALATARTLFHASKAFPVEERCSLTDQTRRSSRSVCSKLAVAGRKRRHKAAFVSKLSDAEGEAAETQVWIEFAVQCGRFPAENARQPYREYDGIPSTIVGMITHADTWIMGPN